MLPYDIARCQGSGSEYDGWREGCEDCLRRTEPGNPNHQWNMSPPEIIAFECVFYINPN